MIRVFRHYVPRSLLILGTGEALILFGSVYVGVGLPLLEFNPTDNLLVGHIWTKGLLYTAVVQLIMAGVGLYQRGLRDDLPAAIFRIGVAMLAGMAVISIAMTLIPHLSIGKTAFLVTFASSAMGIALFRVLVNRYLDSSYFKRRILVLGAGELAAQVEGLRRRSDWQDIELVGYVPLPGESPAVQPRKTLPLISTLRELVQRQRVDEIVVAIGDRRRHFPINEILDCKMSGVQVIDIVDFFERQTGRINIDSLNPSSLIYADGYIDAVIRTTMHRMFDLVVSIVMLIITLPITLATAFVIWIESGLRGPVLYRQTRVGRDGRLFRILKFRSMTVDAEGQGGAQWAVPGDSRVTFIGAVIRVTRIDELPQLVNVLKGEMSFVGPRPERPEFVESLANEIPFYDLRHRVNPGITGWAQICYPYGASREDAKDKLEYDLYYIKNYSLFLDLMILIQTAQVILSGKGAR